MRRSCKKRENSKCADEPYENLNAQSTTVCTEDAAAKFENHDVSCHYSEEPFHHKSDVTSLPNSYASHCEIVQDAVFADTTFPSCPMDETEPGILGGPDFTSSILMTDAYPFLPFKHEETAEREEPAEEAQPRTGLEGALAKFTGYSEKFHFESAAHFCHSKGTTKNFSHHAQVNHRNEQDFTCQTRPASQKLNLALNNEVVRESCVLHSTSTHSILS